MSDRMKSVGFVMTLIIVFYHFNYNSEAASSFDGKANAIVNLAAGAFAVVAMCWFFSISGFLLFRNLTLKNYAKKLKKRVTSLLVPYFIWEIAAFVWLIIMSIIRRDAIVPTEFFRNFFDGVFIMKRFPPNGALWYLYALFFLTALSPIFLLLFKNKKVGWVSIVALTMIIYYLNNTENVINRQIFSYGYVRLIFSYLPSFLIGAFMGYFSENSDGTDKLKYILPLLFASVLFEVFFTGIAKDTVTRILPILILYFMPNFSAFDNRKIYRISFLIYVIHQPILEIRRILLPNLLKLPYAFCATLALRFVFIVIIIAVASLIHFVLRKINPKLLNVVTGGRS